MSTPLIAIAGGGAAGFFAAITCAEAVGTKATVVIYEATAHLLAKVLVSEGPHRVIVFGARPLRPAVVDAPYIIRAAVALYAVAASIPGQSIVKNADAIRRAHPRFVENLRALGAAVEWR